MPSRPYKFLSYYRPYLRVFLVLMICALLSALITLVLPLLIRYITKTVLESDLTTALEQIYSVGVVMAVLIAVQAGLNYIVDYRGHALGAMMERDMRRELFGHLQQQSFGFFDQHKTGQLMSRITNDLLSLTELYHHGPEDLVLNIVKFTGAFIILFQVDTGITWIVFLFLPPLAWFSWIFNVRMHAALKRNKERIAEINAQVEDSLAGIRVVKSFANEDLEQAKFEVENERFLVSRKDGYRNEAYFSQGVTALTQMITTAVVVFGGIRIVDATLDLADLLTFLLYSAFLIEPIHKFLHFSMQYQEGVTGFERFMELMEIEPEIQTQPGAKALGEFHGEVEFRGVSFSYGPDRPEVFKDLSMTIHAGDLVALVGSSGVGKTTLCSLIPRFYEVNEGEILLDGVSIRQMDLRSLREKIGVVQQDVYLFAGTILDNIRYGKPEAGMEEVIQAARRAHAHDFIMALPQGYHTDIGQRGVKLSGGQKQRLSIARVFLKNPPILIFDEATSALDNESERVVQEALMELAQGRTTLVIAHRLSTIRAARRIVVLTDQGIEADGSHESLVAGGGLYARLYNLQFDLL